MIRIFSRSFRCVRRAARPLGAFVLCLFVLILSFGGLDGLLGMRSWFSPDDARAAYTGKTMRTVEYLLGGASDNTARGDDVLAYAGGSWNAVKATAGTKPIVIEGSGIRVVNAYLDVGFIIAGNADIADLSVFIDVDESSSQGTDAPVGEEMATLPLQSSGLSSYFRSTHDVTAFFDRQTDAMWAAGVGVVAGLQVDMSGAVNRSLSTIKLVITYEQDYSATAHTETKTVRFPLDSTNGTDTGTRQAQCAAAATCSFSYLADIPDATADGDILDVYFEIQGEVDSTTASTLQPTVNGGTAGPAFNWNEAIANDMTVNVAWAPAVGGSDFLRNTAQTLDVTLGTVPVNVLGGELVVTYRYQTDATEQTETVRYFVDQRLTAPGATKNAFATTSIDVSNPGMSVKNLWLRSHIAPVAAGNYTIYHKVGTTTERNKVYAITAASARAGDTPTIVHDMSADAGNFYTSPTAIAGATQFSAGGSVSAIEAWVTFTWNGTSGTTVTKSVTFSGSQQGVTATGNQWNNKPAHLMLSEIATKTYRSAYIETLMTHSDATSLTTGTITIGVNAVTSAIAETADATSETYHTTYFHEIASTTFSNGNTIAWTSRSIELNETHSMAEEVFYGNMVIVTYDVALGETPETPSKKQLRTVEYLLGGGSDNTARADNALAYAGGSWNAVKGTAGTKNIIIDGRNVHVVNAYLDVSFVVASAVNVNNLAVTLDVEGSSSSGTDTRVAEELSLAPFQTSGVTGYLRSTHDVTALFDRQTDAEWSAGLSVVAGVQADFSGAGNRSLTNAKLVVTYESDFTLVPHTETKTVRFPLDSTNGSDRGTRTTQCAAAATCSFSYLADIPDATADGDILDVYFDIQGEVNSGSVSTLQPTINGGTAGTAFNWVEVLTDDTMVNVAWAPAVGGSDFLRNTAQTLDLLMGTVPMNVLGGELVVTYRYSTGATAQTETVRYFLDQRTAAPGVTRNNFATTTMTVSNVGMSMKHVWYKIHTAPTAGNTFTVFGKVGTSTEASIGYTIAATNPRAGDTPTIIFDLSDRAGNFFASSTAVTGATQFSAGGAPPSVEAYFTFTWRGDLNGTTTRSVLFSGAQQGNADIANEMYNRAAEIMLPETVQKTYRDAYVKAHFIHSDTTSIAVGTVTIGVNASSTVVTESTDGTNEAFHAIYFHHIASTTFSNGNTIPWEHRSLEISETHSTANEGFFGNVVVVTYDAAHELKTPKYIQNYFRLYTDNDALLPTDPWPAGATNLGENAEISPTDFPPIDGDRIRMRMSVQVATTTLIATSTAFKLQYAPRLSTCAAASGWNDVGAIASGAIWRGFDTSVTNNRALSNDPPAGGDLVLSVADRAGRFSEQNASDYNPFAVAVGEDAEYDWVVQLNGAATNTPYCFRMAESNGTLFDRYDFYPAVRTAGYLPESKNWRWYGDELSETPVVDLALENTAPSSITQNDLLKLRITINETNAENGPNQKFRMQFSDTADFSSGVFFVDATTTCTVASVWCYGDGVDQDGDAITTRVLSDSTANGRHNEAPTTTSTLYAAASTATEFEFTLRNAGGAPNVTYFFRPYDVSHAHPVALGSGEAYPSLSTEGTLLTVTILGLATSTATEGVTTDVASAPSEAQFGTLPFNTDIDTAQRIRVTTNANRGYKVYVSAMQGMLSGTGAEIPAVTGTNASPSAWATGCAASASGCFGYHAGDDALEGGSTRFLTDDTFAGLESTAREIIYSPGAVTDEDTDIVYRLRVSEWQEEGEYSGRIVYVVVPMF